MYIRRVPDRAGVIAPPPLIFAIPFLAGYFTRSLLPRIEVPLWVSAGLIAAAIAFAGSAAWRMHRARTTIEPFGSTTAIVTSGPFRVTRNPLYVSMTIFYVGLSLLTGATTALVLLPVALVVIRYGVVAREERYLASKFPEYRDYCARVRRWI